MKRKSPQLVRPARPQSVDDTRLVRIIEPNGIAHAESLPFVPTKPFSFGAAAVLGVDSIGQEIEGETIQVANGSTVWPMSCGDLALAVRCTPWIADWSTSSGHYRAAEEWIAYHYFAGRRPALWLARTSDWELPHRDEYLQGDGIVPWESRGGYLANYLIPLPDGTINDEEIWEFNGEKFNPTYSEGLAWAWFEIEETGFVEPDTITAASHNIQDGGWIVHSAGGEAPCEIGGEVRLHAPPPEWGYLSLPPSLAVDKTYYLAETVDVTVYGLTLHKFRLAATPGGPPITISVGPYDYYACGAYGRGNRVNVRKGGFWSLIVSHVASVDLSESTTLRISAQIGPQSDYLGSVSYAYSRLRLQAWKTRPETRVVIRKCGALYVPGVDWPA